MSNPNADAAAPTAPRILVVGAGAVGQTYARHLALGGAQVTFLVKPHHAEALRGGVRMHPSDRKAGPVTFADFALATDVRDLDGARWDQIWLTMASPALRQPWFLDLAPHIGDATVVTLQPGLEDRQWLLERMPAEQLVSGLIAFLAYQAPLPGETLEPGIAYWFPPLSPSPFSGPAARVEAVVATLTRGGCPAKIVADVPGRVAVGASLLSPTIAGLEAAGWSFRELGRRAALRQVTRAAAEAVGVAAPRRRWLVRLLFRPLFLRVVLRAAPRFVPFDLETYLRVHFTKVGEQTRETLRLYVRRAGERGLPREHLQALVTALRA